MMKLTNDVVTVRAVAEGLTSRPMEAPADAKSARSHDHKRSTQPVSHPLYQVDHGYRECSPRVAGISEKHHTATGPLVCINELPEVLVLGNQDSAFADSKVDYVVV